MEEDKPVGEQQQPAAPTDPTAANAPEPPVSYAHLPSTNLPAVVAKSTSATTPGVPAQTQTPGSPTPVSGVPDKFAVDEVIGYAWTSMLKYFWPLTGVLSCNFLVQSVPVVASMVLNYATTASTAVTILAAAASFIGGILGFVIVFGTFNLWIRIIDGDTVTVRDVYSKYKRTWNFLLASFLYGLMVGAGYICLIVPGIYLQLRFQFYPYFIIDSDASPLTSLKASWAISKGSLAELFFLGIINYFIGWIGMLCLLIGSFPAHMIQSIALAKTYRMLRKNTPLSEMPPSLMPLTLISDSEPPPPLNV